MSIDMKRGGKQWLAFSSHTWLSSIQLKEFSILTRFLPSNARIGISNQCVVTEEKMRNEFFFDSAWPSLAASPRPSPPKHRLRWSNYLKKADETD